MLDEEKYPRYHMEMFKRGGCSWQLVAPLVLFQLEVLEQIKSLLGSWSKMPGTLGTTKEEEDKYPR